MATVRYSSCLATWQYWADLMFWAIRGLCISDNGFTKCSVRLLKQRVAFQARPYSRILSSLFCGWFPVQITTLSKGIYSVSFDGVFLRFDSGLYHMGLLRLLALSLLRNICNELILTWPCRWRTCFLMKCKLGLSARSKNVVKLSMVPAWRLLWGSYYRNKVEGFQVV